MLLYHGSNVEVQKPRLFESDRRVDFGPGFYLTSSEDQARRWAQLVAKRRGQGRPLVSVFEFDESQLGTLNHLVFDKATVEWLAFVGANRRGEPTEDYDLVVGPVANDDTMPTLRLYFSGNYTEDEAIRRLMPQTLNDQYAFKTRRALETLSFRKGVPA